MLKKKWKGKWVSVLDIHFVGKHNFTYIMFLLPNNQNKASKINNSSGKLGLFNTSNTEAIKIRYFL